MSIPGTDIRQKSNCERLAVYCNEPNSYCGFPFRRCHYHERPLPFASSLRIAITSHPTSQNMFLTSEQHLLQPRSLLTLFRKPVPAAAMKLVVSPSLARSSLLRNGLHLGANHILIGWGSKPKELISHVRTNHCASTANAVGAFTAFRRSITASLVTWPTWRAHSSFDRVLLFH